ncbi:MAG: hypothetical protein KGS61_15220, partial [Verrucomicrobia bacterium]|nr:hypothetical protein [Verrucomicrobiota bacterium]
KSSLWKRLIGLGTVARVVRSAPCPTLVLPRRWRVTPEQYRPAALPDVRQPTQGRESASAVIQFGR